jgi:hypothetical protein
MRKLVVLSGLALAVATPALGQVTQSQLEDLRVQQQAAERRFIDQSNQLQALENRLRADQASADLTAQRAGVATARARPLRTTSLRMGHHMGVQRPLA